MEVVKKKSRRERVYQQLVDLTQQITVKHINAMDIRNLDASGIGTSLNITSNNTCMELNALVKSGKVVKILGRPVYFFAREELETIIGKKVEQCVWENYDGFKQFINAQRPPEPQVTVPDAPSETKKVGNAFSSLVGADQSLRRSVNQAEAAILYPPDGLHTLIIGETGTGKSHLAEAMFKFAEETGVVDKSAKFVIYNCANYSENPQLLLSQLFGYRKGAFTGADKDTPGVVDQADNGVLFLDEAHRLSPEGQEKMFLLMDKGIFQRLGETREYHHAKIRIIAATTEDPKNSLLPTFLRRIPVVINVPPLENRSFDERIRFVFRFLWEESRNTGYPFCVDREVIRCLTMYNCPGNIGQLRGDIRCAAANAYLDYYTLNASGRRPDCISLKLAHLPDSVEKGLYDAHALFSDRIFERYAFYRERNIRIDSTAGDYEALAQLAK